MELSREEVLLLGFTKGKNGTDILVVGKRHPEKKGLTEIINLFEGEEATELYKKLTCKQEEKDGRN